MPLRLVFGVDLGSPVDCNLISNEVTLEKVVAPEDVHAGHVETFHQGFLNKPWVWSEEFRAVDVVRVQDIALADFWVAKSCSNRVRRFYGDRPVAPPGFQPGCTVLSPVKCGSRDACPSRRRWEEAISRPAAHATPRNAA